MTKGLMFVVASFSVFSLTACDLFNKGNKEEEKSVADSIVYGTGAEDLVLAVGSAILAGEYVATFKVGTHFQAGANGLVIVRSLSGSEQAIFYSHFCLQ